LAASKFVLGLEPIPFIVIVLDGFVHIELIVARQDLRSVVRQLLLLTLVAYTTKLDTPSILGPP